MDKAKAQAATKDISDLLHQAFEKHKTVTKGLFSYVLRRSGCPDSS